MNKIEFFELEFVIEDRVESKKEKVIKYMRQYYKGNKEKIRQQQKQWNIKNKDYQKDYQKQWRENNKDYQKQWNIKNKDYQKDYSKKSYKNPKIRARYIAKAIKYNKTDKAKKQHLKYSKKRYHIDQNYRLNRIMSSSIYQALKGIGGKQNNSWLNLVDYTVQDLKEHLEKLFKPGMSWDNRGKWHIDHIFPKSKFNYTSCYDPEFKKCWALDNLQPLWAAENISKGNKVIPQKN